MNSPSSRCYRGRWRTTRRGSFHYTRCGCTISSVCASCAEDFRVAFIAHVQEGLRGVTLEQVAWVTLTLPAGSDWRNEAARNAVVTVLFDRFRRRVRRHFGRCEYVRVVEVTEAGMTHIHALLVRSGAVWSSDDLATMRALAGAVETCGADGELVRFGAEMRVVHPSSADHLGNIPRYLGKMLGDDWLASPRSRRMDAYAVVLRSLGRLPLPPVRRSSRVGGFGWRGRRSSFSSGWGSAVPAPATPVAASLLPVGDAVSSLLSLDEFLGLLLRPVPLLC